MCSRKKAMKELKQKFPDKTFLFLHANSKLHSPVKKLRKSKFLCHKNVFLETSNHFQKIWPKAVFQFGFVLFSRE